MELRNQILITLDSLRHDVFDAARMPFLKKHPWACAWTQGTYTLPAHTAFFASKLPHTFTGQFDTCARYARKCNKPMWRLSNPESPYAGKLVLEGKNIVDGFNRLGYQTIGTGAVGWFNTEKCEAYIPTVDDFQDFGFFGPFIHAKQQIKFIRERLDPPFFMFVNFGETHNPYIIGKNDKPVGWGAPHDVCFKAQVRCAEYLDNAVKELLADVTDADVLVCGDHGDCMGEDGLWGHSFYHEKVMQVPVVSLTL